MYFDRIACIFILQNEIKLQEAPLEGEWEEEEEEQGPRREAKWWYSTFHTVTAMVGAGVLSLPYAMAYLGWYENTS